MNTYTQEQIDQARSNNKKLQDCPQWMQNMFLNCPYNDTLCQNNDGRWTSEWLGDSHNYIYRISYDWPAHCNLNIPILTVTEYMVSMDSRNWSKREILGVVEGQYIDIHAGKWHYIKPIPVDCTVTLADGTKIELSEESYAKLKEAVK